MTTTPPLSGIDIGNAANATRSLLDRLLDEADFTFPEWVAMITLVQEGPAIERGALTADLAQKLTTGPEAAVTLLDDLTSKGIVREHPIADHVGTTVELTTNGLERVNRLRATVQRVTSELYRDFDAGDLETTRRVLIQVTARARTLAAEGRAENAH